MTYEINKSHSIAQISYFTSLILLNVNVNVNKYTLFILQ